MPAKAQAPLNAGRPECTPSARPIRADHASVAHADYPLSSSQAPGPPRMPHRPSKSLSDSVRGASNGMPVHAHGDFRPRTAVRGALASGQVQRRRTTMTQVTLVSLRGAREPMGHRRHVDAIWAVLALAVVLCLAAGCASAQASDSKLARDPTLAAWIDSVDLRIPLQAEH